MIKQVKIILIAVLAALFVAALTIYLVDALNPEDPTDPSDRTREIICLVVMALVALVALILIANTFGGERTKSGLSTRAIVDGAMCVALAFVLSYIRLYRMPTGGSITLASMLPLCIYANRYGVFNGLVACVIYGLLQFIQGGCQVLTWTQVLLEYPIAFGVIAIGGLFKKLPYGILLGCFLRFLCHFFASLLFWSEYLPDTYSSNLWVASLIYNGVYMGVDTLICLVLSLLPPVNKTINLIFDRRKRA